VLALSVKLYLFPNLTSITRLLLDCLSTNTISAPSV